MQDKEIKLEEIEASHTLGRAEEGRVQGREKWRGCTCYSAAEQYTIAIWSRRRRHEAWSDTEETNRSTVNSLINLQVL